jgi:hypothetical protein
MTVADSAGPWPVDFPTTSDGGVAEGLEVRSQSGTIGGRTTGSRRPCISTGCPGWFIGVRWETGQLMFICSEGWAYDPASQSIRVTGGGEVSARFVSPTPLGTPPLPRDEWPDWATLVRWKGWRTESTPPRRDTSHRPTP